MSDPEINWPSPPTASDEAAATLYSARVDFELQRRLKSLDRLSIEQQSNLTERTQALQAEDRLREAVQNAYLNSSAQAVDRSVKRAELVVKTAAAIASVQTGLTALYYGADRAKEIPTHVMVPMIAIACSIGLAAGYLGFLGRKVIEGNPLVASLAPKQQAARLSLYINWVNAAVFARAALLRLSVVALALGTGLMPIALIRDPPKLIYVVASLIAIIVLAVEIRRGRATGKS